MNQPQVPCALRRCKGRAGCLCPLAGPFAAARRSPAPARAGPCEPTLRQLLAGGGGGPAADPPAGQLPASATPKPRTRPAVAAVAMTTETAEGFAAAIGVDPAAEPGLRWIPKLGFAAALPTSWERKAAVRGGRLQFVEKHSGSVQDNHPMVDYYRQLTGYVRGVLGAGATDAMEPEPEGEEPLCEASEEEEAAAAAGVPHKPRKPKRRRRPVLNLAAGKSARPVLRLACAALDWREEPADSGPGTVYWVVHEKVRPALPHCAPRGAIKPGASWPAPVGQCFSHGPRHVSPCPQDLADRLPRLKKGQAAARIPGLHQ